MDTSWSGDCGMRLNSVQPASNVASQELGDVGGRAVGTVALEALERELVEGLHGRRQAGASRLLRVCQPAPHLHAVTGRRIGPADTGGLLGRHLDGVGEPPGRVPDAKPAVAEPARPPDRYVGTTPDDHGDGRGRRGRDDRVVKVEERAVEAGGRAGQELAHDGEALVHPQTPGRRVHPADRDFMAVLAPHADSEDEATGSDPVDVRELAGHQDGMAQRQQVDAGVDGQGGMKHGQRGGSARARRTPRRQS